MNCGEGEISLTNTVTEGEMLIGQLKETWAKSLKQTCSEVMEKVVLLEDAFKLDCKLYVLGQTDTQFQDSEILSSQERKMLEDDVENMTRDIEMLEKELNDAKDQGLVGEDDSSLHPQFVDEGTVRRDNVEDGNGESPLVFDETENHEHDGNLDHENAHGFDDSFDLDDIDGLASTGDNKVNNDKDDNDDNQIPNVNTNLIGRDDSILKLQPIISHDGDSRKQQIGPQEGKENLWSTTSGNPDACSEPFFTQDESLFDRCVEALTSMDYGRETINTKSENDFRNSSPSERVNEIPKSSANSQINSSDEMLADAYTVVSSATNRNPSFDNDEAPTTSRAVLLRSTAPTGRASNSVPPTTQTVDYITNNNPSTSRETNTTDISRTPLVTAPTIPMETSPIAPATTMVASLPVPIDLPHNISMASNCMGDIVPLCNSNGSNWVLAVSSGVKRNSKLMTKVKDFVAITNCQLRSSFNYSTTHLIVIKGEKRRQVDFFTALSSGRFVVEVEWIIRSLEENRLLPHEPFLVNPDVSNLHVGNHSDMTDSQQETFIFGGHQICCVGNFTAFSSDDLRRLVEMCGGTYVVDPVLFEKNQVAIVVVEPGVYDPEFDDQYRRANEESGKYEVVSLNWLLNSISIGKALSPNDFPCSIPAVDS